jgi:hypothetical protein
LLDEIAAENAHSKLVVKAIVVVLSHPPSTQRALERVMILEENMLSNIVEKFNIQALNLGKINIINIFSFKREPLHFLTENNFTAYIALEVNIIIQAHS